MSNKNYLKILADSSWDLRCVDMGEDMVGWIVVGHYMGAPTKRVLGVSYVEDEPEKAIKDAIAMTLDGDGDYLWDLKDTDWMDSD